MISSILLKRIIFHRQERYLKRVCLFLIFILFATSYYLYLHHPESLSDEKIFLALGIIWVSFFPAIQYLSDQNRPPIPFLPLVGIFYFSSFGLPMFNENVKDTTGFSVESVSTQALSLVVQGLLGMCIAFYVSKSSIWKKVPPINLPKSYSLTKIINILKLLLLSHILSLFTPIFKGIPSIGILLDASGYLSYGMFYIIGSRGQLSFYPTIKLFVIISFVFELLLRFISGALAGVLNLGLFLGIIIFNERKKIPIFLMAILITFFVFFQGIKGDYRRLISTKYSQANPIEKAQLFIDLAVKNYSKQNESESQKKSSSGDDALGRTAHIIVFSKVVDSTPAIIPYWGGATYVNLFTTYIPRAVWPDKPQELIGNVFGRRYKFLGSNDYSTSFNLPWIVEMYTNFGTLGVLIGMPLVGLLLAFLEQKLNSLKMSSLEVVIGATVLFSLVYQESNLSLMLGGAINLSLVLYLTFRFLLRGKPKINKNKNC
jgi:hypothetical protein